jgi:Protein of unknown function (DUF3761)
MKSLLVSVALGAGFLLSVGAYADAPAGSTAQCKDGTYYSGASHKGACKGHDGVKEWLDKTAATPAAKPAAAPATKSTPAKSDAAPVATATPAAAKSKKTKKTTAAASAAPTTATPTAPSGATAQCRDGTYYSGASHKGACKGHQGVKEWLDGGAATTAAKPVAPPKAAPAPAPVVTAPATKAPAATATAPAAAPAAPAAAATRTPPTPASQIEQKAGGGAGMVWVNSASKVYHCQGDEWYGKTKEGSYMSESAATAGGNHAARGKECGK